MATLGGEFRALFRLFPRTSYERDLRPASLGYKAWLRRAHREGIITAEELRKYEVAHVMLPSIEKSIDDEEK